MAQKKRNQGRSQGGSRGPRKGPAKKAPAKQTPAQSTSAAKEAPAGKPAPAERAPAATPEPARVEAPRPTAPERALAPQRTGRFYFDFMGKKWIFFGVSAVLIALGLVGILARGLQFGLEFRGGTAMDLTMKRAFTVEQVRSIMTKAGQGDAVIQIVEKPGQPASEAREVLIRSRRLLPAQVTQVLADLEKSIGISTQNSVQTVGPGWGANVTNAAVTALAVSLLGLITYISLRFEYKMALTAVLAIIHDIILTLGIYALFGREITPNTVAALLTILGYSLYDTIVVFHRIKENTAHIGKETFQQMASESINQVIVRSINTTMTTLIPVLTLLFFGGETLKDFAFALAIGLASGAYSSVGIAAPIYAMWKETEPKYSALKRKYGMANA